MTEVEIRFDVVIRNSRELFGRFKSQLPQDYGLIENWDAFEEVVRDMIRYDGMVLTIKGIGNIQLPNRDDEIFTSILTCAKKDFGDKITLI